MEWKWADVSGQCIRFPDTKSGAQVRAIGKTAAELLIARRDGNGGMWAFPAVHGDGHFVGLPRILDRVCDRAGLADVSPHVLRHTFATVAGGLGFSAITIAGLLGHRVPGITGRYVHAADRALLVAADQVSEAIQATLDQPPQEVPVPA